MTPGQTADIVVLVLTIGLVGAGFLSIALGWIVNRYVAPSTGSEPAPAGSSTGSDQAVLPQQHQPEPAPPLDFDDMIDYLTQHNLTDEQTIDLLTLMRRNDGDLLSANKIRDIVGGNEAAVKARVAAWRPKAEPQRSQGRVARPDGGW